MSTIYLDYNATTPVDTKVEEKITWAIKNCWHNASSLYAKSSRDELLNAEITVKKFLWPKGIPNCVTNIIFTSGATESNFTLINAISTTSVDIMKPLVITSRIEHDSVVCAIQQFEKRGLIDVFWLPVKENGIVDMDCMESINVTNRPIVFGSMMLANNETGVIQPVAAFCNKLKFMTDVVLTHSDISQAIGKIPVDLDELNVDFVTFTGHKFYAPKGIGVIVTKGESAEHLLRMNPLLCGGNQQDGFRSGTECLPMIIGISEAFKQLSTNMNLCNIKFERNRLEKELIKKCPNAMIVGYDVERLPNTSMILGVSNLLDSSILVTRGCGAACNSQSGSRSHVLDAMGLYNFKLAQDGNIVRISLGKFTTSSEIDEAILRINRNN